ncbi:bifunctional 5,10-methylenetetrahydrofolate dehydrogenase/5,10-methenyltetrahydrofolate cyclohydrolase [Oxyplasma meridianum]|uniref:Bifunctional protein FolD n=1 Tax=Oxyplasma meridianum TaxID=3073602 RepID=A0AAX4NG05_9ARCH
MTRIINVDEIVKRIKEDLTEGFSEFFSKHGRMPSLVSIIIGDSKEAAVYANAKARSGKRMGVDVSIKNINPSIGQEKIEEEIRKISWDPGVDGIILENPVPKGLDYISLLSCISPLKDVDCMTPYNQGLIAMKSPVVLPATAGAVNQILLENYPEIRDVVIINRSVVVGKPLAMILINRDCTVTVCHSKTLNIREKTKNAEVVVVAVGKENFLGADYVNQSSVVIDVGINSTEDGIRGDANFASLNGFVTAITPVPGGVGKLTSVKIFQNLKHLMDFRK